MKMLFKNIYFCLYYDRTFWFWGSKLGGGSNREVLEPSNSRWSWGDQCRHKDAFSCQVWSHYLMHYTSLENNMFCHFVCFKSDRDRRHHRLLQGLCCSCSCGAAGSEGSREQEQLGKGWQQSGSCRGRGPWACVLLLHWTSYSGQTSR